jgi:hypothetical protein
MPAPRPTIEIHNAHVQANGGYGQNMVLLENVLGSVQLGICTTCSYIEATCTCSINIWYNEAGEVAGINDGVTLLCAMCGNDGT